MSKVDPLAPGTFQTKLTAKGQRRPSRAAGSSWTLIDEYYRMMVGRPPMAHLSICGLDDMKSVACAPARESTTTACTMPGYSIGLAQQQRTPKGMRRILGRRWEKQ